VLLKPESDTRSQVIVLGQVDDAAAAVPWRERAPMLWPVIAQSLDALREECDVVVIEGAGSPAEINLMDCDLTNMRVAAHADARCILVTDIDRGGAFAHLYGTWSLLPARDRARIAGFVLNRFRGDAALLAPAPAMLERMTGVPTVATVPLLQGHGLPEEDGMGVHAAPATARLRIAIVAWPRISNLDEFEPLLRMPHVHVTWARDAAQLAAADWVILPGSKQTSADLAWLRSRGMDAAVAAHAAQGKPVLGICGGLQALGEALVDIHGIDGNAPGLGLLPLVTLFEPDKIVRRQSATFGSVDGPWAPLSGLVLDGYEIRHGRTAQHAGMAAGRPVLGQDLGWQAGSVLGISVHGLFESAAVQQALFGCTVPALDAAFETLANAVQSAFAPGVLETLVR
jgi:adenosylcobyric acid synthase